MRHWLRGYLGINHVLRTLGDLRAEVELMASQETVDALVASVDDVRNVIIASTDRLGFSIDGVQGDLDALIAANPGVDTTALEASVSSLRDASAPLSAVADRLAAVDAENPALPPVDPTA